MVHNTDETKVFVPMMNVSRRTIYKGTGVDPDDASEVLCTEILDKLHLTRRGFVVRAVQDVLPNSIALFEVEL